MQRSAIPPLRIATVDIVLGDESLHPREVALFRRIEERAVAPEQISYVLVSLSNEVQRSRAVSVLLRGIRAMSKKQTHDFAFALGGCFVQGRELPQVSYVYRRSVLHQKLGHLVVTVGTSVVKRHQPTEQ